MKRARRSVEEAARESALLRRAFYRTRAAAHDARLKVGGAPAGARGASEVPAPERVVWIFCTSRSGSSWLRAMLADALGAKVWEEPKVGQLFGVVHAGAQEGQLGSKHFVLGDPTRRVWRGAVREFVLATARGANPDLAPEDYLVVKEPDGATGAPVLLEALPESRAVLLVRDPRDTAASALDGMRRGGWMNRKQDRDRREETARKVEDPDEYVVRRTRAWRRQIGAAETALDAHPGPKSTLLYEDLLTDTDAALGKLCRELDLPVPAEDLARVAERHAWKNVPASEKGSGKFYRKGSVGGWREDLTEEQARLARRTAGPLMDRLYPEREDG